LSIRALPKLIALATLLLIPFTLFAQTSDNIPLRSWPAPLFWQPSIAENKLSLSGTVTESAADALPANSLVFVAMTPCRVIDTRNPNGTFGGPALTGGVARSFPIPTSSSCTIPATARAYSLNITIVPPGFVDFVTVWPTGVVRPFASTLNGYVANVIANAAIVPAGTNGSIDVYASQNTHLIIDINGYYASQTGINLTQGTAAAPSLSFNGDAGTGIYSSGAGTLNIATGGTNRLSVAPNGDVNSTGNLNVSGNIIANGNVGIGNPSPGFKLDVVGNMRAVGNVSTDINVQTTGPTNAWAQFGMQTLNQRWLLGTSQNFDDDEFYVFDATYGGNPRMGVKPNNGPIYFPTGNIGIGTVNPSAKLQVVAPNAAGVHATSAGNAILGYSTTPGFAAIYGENLQGIGVWASGSAAGIAGPALRANNTNPNGIGIYSTTSSADANLVVGNAGSGDLIRGFCAACSDASFRVTNSGMTVTPVLQITGGSDVAEHFQVDKAIQPGMVVAIDPKSEGKLTLSRGAYNRKAVGVISGANELHPGMVLPEPNGATDAPALTLSGRVWVYCDATKNPVKAGDLLTTSDTPGYAMKVTNYRKAQGAIIGKALTDLKGQRGLVLMLASLQ
jgi:hypothetical protein